jgi:O-antigen ligase
MEAQWEEAGPEGGDVEVLARLCSTGLFNDPNDLCLILIFASIACLYLAAEERGHLRRLSYYLPVGVFLYALSRTQSRGGFLALLAGIVSLFLSRFGVRRAIPFVLVIVPAMFIFFGGRQTRIDTSRGTSAERIQLWAEGLSLFRSHPVFGIGMGHYQQEFGLVAHNSFVHCYVELGMLGGTLFVGAFYFGFRGLRRLQSRDILILDESMRRLRPFLLAMLAAYITGYMSLSRAYVEPTYLVFGLVAAYLRVVPTHPPGPLVKFDRRTAGHLVLCSIAVLIGLSIVVRFTVNWSGS